MEEKDGFGNSLSQAFQKPTNQNVSESKYAPLDKQLLNSVSGKFLICPYAQAVSAMRQCIQGRGVPTKTAFISLAVKLLLNCFYPRPPSRILSFLFFLVLVQTFASKKSDYNEAANAHKAFNQVRIWMLDCVLQNQLLAVLLLINMHRSQEN